MKIELVGKKKETGDAVTFILKSQMPTEWKAGQFLFYTFPHQSPDERGITRYFTISSAPHEQDIWITTRINNKKPSSFKSKLLKIKVGQAIEASDPDGDFIVENPEKKYVFIAGGIGITPYRSILLDLDHKNLPINVTLLWANSDKNFAFKDELEKLAEEHKNFKIKYFISPCHIEKEDIQKTIDELSAINDKPIIYVSGPEPMVEEFGRMLKKTGIAENRIKQDFFPGYDTIK